MKKSSTTDSRGKRLAALFVLGCLVVATGWAQEETGTADAHPFAQAAVNFEGRRITTLPPHRVTRLGLARTFQNIRLFKEMTALENVMVGRHSRTASGWFGAIFHFPWVNREERETLENARETLDGDGGDAGGGGVHDGTGTGCDPYPDQLLKEMD